METFRDIQILGLKLDFAVIYETVVECGIVTPFSELLVLLTRGVLLETLGRDITALMELAFHYHPEWKISGEGRVL